MTSLPTIGIGLAGLGNVGAGVLRHLRANRDLLASRLGFAIEVRRVVVRDPSKLRDPAPEPGQIVPHWRDLVADPEVRIVVELMGGLTEARELVKAAIAAGKPVVTANKALLAEHGQEIFRLAEEAGVPVFFEAAVAGGIPIIKAVQEGFVGNHIEAIHGIINGTCNYILTRMTDQCGLSYQDALAEASAKGYAEADPYLDVSGWDAAHKALILAALSYGFWIPPAQITVEGIQDITAADIQYARQLGYRVKLLAILRGDAAHGVEVRVHPTLIPQTHVLASVNGVFNAVVVRGDVVGETLFYGRGAGQDPTSSAVLADLAEAGRFLSGGRQSTNFIPHGLYGKCRPNDESSSEYFLRLAVDDRPGVLAQIASLLGDAGIGISSVVQPPPLANGEDRDAVPLVLLLYFATHRQITDALASIAALPCVKQPPALIRVENFSE